MLSDLEVVERALRTLMSLPSLALGMSCWSRALRATVEAERTIRARPRRGGRGQHVLVAADTSLLRLADHDTAGVSPDGRLALFDRSNASSTTCHPREDHQQHPVRTTTPSSTGLEEEIMAGKNYAEVTGSAVEWTGTGNR